MAFEDDLLALERRVLTDSVGDFLTAVDELKRMLATGASGIERKLITLAIPRIEDVARTGVVEGFALGAEWALGLLLHSGDNAVDGFDRRRAETAVQYAPASLTDPFDGLDVMVSTSKATAVRLLGAGADIDAALAPVFHAANRTRATIVTQMNTASNTASLMVAQEAGTLAVWVNERDACTYCLGLAGEVVQPGDDFPRADLYDDGPTSKRIVQAPPLHPNCRCQLSVLNDRSYADALQREAQRSILRGFSLSSESNAVRVRAAKRLLERDPIAPKSVKDYARRAVKAGRFPRGRDVPVGDPRLIVK